MANKLRVSVGITRASVLAIGMGAVAREMSFSGADGDDSKGKIIRIAGITALALLSERLVVALGKIFRPDKDKQEAEGENTIQHTDIVPGEAGGAPTPLLISHDKTPPEMILARRQPKLSIPLMITGSMLAAGTIGGVALIAYNDENGGWLKCLSASTALINHGFRMFEVSGRIIGGGLSAWQMIPLGFTFVGAGVSWGATIGTHASKVLEQRASLPASGAMAL